MKVLHINPSDILGGAARAAYRIHSGLQNAGVDSHMMVWQKFSDDPSVHSPYPSKGLKLAQLRASLGSRICRLEKYPPDVYKSANVFPNNFVKAINNFDCDLVHLHWVGAELIQIEQLPKINKPIIWTHHDQWAFCGCCHYDLAGDKRYIEGYSKSNRPAYLKGIDIDRWVWKRKYRAWNKLPCVHTTPSNWLSECVRQSRLFRESEVNTVFNGLDINLFAPIEKTEARNNLKLPTEKTYILFGASGGVESPIKGLGLLIEALTRLQSLPSIHLLVFGSNHSNAVQKLGIPCDFLGNLNNEQLINAYSAADVMIVPSRMEAFGQTASEALACGTPVVAFAATGLLDIVEHRKCGYLAQPFDTDDLAAGIKWILADTSRYETLCNAARSQVVGKFDINKIVQQFSALYQKLLKSQ